MRHLDRSDPCGEGAADQHTVERDELFEHVRPRDAQCVRATNPGRALRSLRKSLVREVSIVAARFGRAGGHHERKAVAIQWSASLSIAVTE